MNQTIRFVKNPKAKVLEALAKTAEEVELYTQVHDILIPMEGVRITKRVATAVEKLLKAQFGGDYEVTYNIKFSWYELVVGKTINNCYRRIAVMLGYTSEGDTLNIKRVEERNTPYTVGSPNAISSLTKALPNLEANIAAVVKAQEDLEKALNNLGDAKYYVTER